MVDVRQEDFITQDEIDYALCIGSGFADGKFRIYEYFMDLHNQKENADFLKKEYGIGGQSGALPGNSSSNSEHDAKGILLEKGSLLNPYTKVLQLECRRRKNLRADLCRQILFTTGKRRV